MPDARCQVAGVRWQVAAGGWKVGCMCLLPGAWWHVADGSLRAAAWQLAADSTKSKQCGLNSNCNALHPASFQTPSPPLTPPPMPCIPYAAGEEQLERLKPVANRSDSSQHSTCNVQRATCSLIRVNTRSKLQARDWGRWQGVATNRSRMTMLPRT